MEKFLCGVSLSFPVSTASRSCKIANAMVYFFHNYIRQFVTILSLNKTTGRLLTAAI